MDVKLIRALAFHQYLLSLAVCPKAHGPESAKPAREPMSGSERRGPRADRQKSTRLGRSDGQAAMSELVRSCRFWRHRRGPSLILYVVGVCLNRIGKESTSPR
jgi:hypothetical protein